MNVVNTLVQTLRQKTLRSAEALADAGLIAAGDAALAERAAAALPIAVTAQIAELIDPGDALDPIARQFVPAAEELAVTPADRADPIGDEAHSPCPGIVHRYPDRVLLMPVTACAAYCRFCFRREGVGGGVLPEADLAAALAYIRDHDDIWEVIISGGDPLILSPRRLAALIAALDAMPHVATIRIHSRVPVVEPDRIDGALVEALKAETPVYVALHCNHAAELGHGARAACRRLADGGIPLLGQTVLLKGVNDDAGTLERLMRTMVANRIKPYYLHHGDLARGTAHFRTTIAEGQTLMRRLRGRLSGIAQPTYVLDIPGGHGKVPIGPCYLSEAADGLLVEDFKGRSHPYP